MIIVFQLAPLRRLPVIQGPYAGSMRVCFAVGHLSGGLGAVYGSLSITALVWWLLSILLRDFSVIGLFWRVLRGPIITGTIVESIMIQVANIAPQGWIGQP